MSYRLIVYSNMAPELDLVTLQLGASFQKSGNVPVFRWGATCSKLQGHQIQPLGHGVQPWGHKVQP